MFKGEFKAGEWDAFEKVLVKMSNVEPDQIDRVCDCCKICNHNLFFSGLFYTEQEPTVKQQSKSNENLNLESFVRVCIRNGDRLVVQCHSLC